MSKPYVGPLGEDWSGSRVAVVHAAILGATAALIILAWPGQSYAADMKSTAELQKMGYKCKVDPPDTETCTKPGEPTWHCAPVGGPCMQRVAKKEAGPGEMCAGVAGIPCQGGLKCNVTSKNPDASGVCEKDN